MAAHPISPSSGSLDARTLEIDRHVASALREHADVIASFVMSKHAEHHPEDADDGLDDARHAFAKRYVLELADAVETNAPSITDADVVRILASRLASKNPAGVGIEGAYEAILEIEHCVLPYIWDEFPEGSDDMLFAVLRFHTQIVRLVRAELDRLYAALTEHGQDAEQPARIEDHLNTIKGVEGLLAEAMHDAEAQIAHIYNYKLANAGKTALS